MVGLIRSKVARILNTQEIVIAAGSDQGVSYGMIFDVIDEKGEDIKDPDTGEVLGSIDRPKVRVKVVQVQERLSVASTYKKERINIGGSGVRLHSLGSMSSTLSDALMPPKYVTRRQTLKTHEDTWEDLDEKERYVSTGDPVVQVRQDLDAEETQD